MAWLAVSKVVAAICVPMVALVVVLEMVVAGVVTIADSVVAVAVGGSGCKRRGWRHCCSTIDCFRSECLCF